MSRPVVVVRPEPGCAATADAGHGLGLDIACHPLFVMQPVAWDRPAGRFDGLLIGSANALRLAGPGLDQLADLPVYAVGEATAAVARERGMRIVTAGSGGLQALLDSLGDQSLRLLRLAGEERVPLAPPAGIEIVERVAYRSVACPAPPALAETVQSGAIVLLHAAAAARHFSAECDRLGIDRQRVSLAALGPRIAAAAGQGWGALSSASEPTDRALLALAHEMCHEPFVG